MRQFIARCSYVDAIGAIGACLADGLQYAHERNLLHMDIKPSNVLLAGDGQPMLLDFHLAQRPIAAGGPPPAWSGGTPGYMSPEQWGVITAVREGRAVPGAVDRRTDVYSLGVLLYEALGGPVSESPRRGLAAGVSVQFAGLAGALRHHREVPVPSPGRAVSRRGSAGERPAATSEQPAAAGRCQS